MDPGGTELAEQATGAKFGQFHVAPPEFTNATDWNVVFAGVASLNVPVLQLLGPGLVMVCVYVMLEPAETGFGVPLLVTVRSHATVTGVDTDVVLFADVGSLVVAVTVEVAVIVPAAVPAGTFTTTMMSAEDVLASDEPSVQVTVPVAPTAGVVQVQPTGASTDWKVVVPGVASLKETPVDAAGPLLVTVWV